MPIADSKLYRYHVVNLQAVQTGLTHIARACREAISRRDEARTKALTRVYALLLAAWAECRLRKLLLEPNGFTKGDQTTIREKASQVERWHAGVEKAFRRHYSVPNAHLKPPAVPHAAFARLHEITDMLNTDLGPVIELRNRLAHGQWQYAFTSDENEIAEEQMKALRNENLLSLETKRNLLEVLAEILHDLVVSLPTFERDFDDHFRSIAQNRVNLKTRTYEKYAEQLRSRYTRGKSNRARG
jgi:hypothetical protein